MKIPSFTAEELANYAKDKGRKLEGHFIVDKDNEEIFRLLCYYFTSDARFEQKGYSLKKGILLYGGIGCGKTTLMKVFGQNQVGSYAVVSARKVAQDYMQGGYYGNEKHQGCQQYFGLTKAIADPFMHRELGVCFDDLGTEDNKKHYGNENNVMAEVLLNRYDRKHEIGNRTHITTNLSGIEIIEKYGDRAASRMKEVLNFIEFPSSAKDRRK